MIISEKKKVNVIISTLNIKNDDISNEIDDISNEKNSQDLKILIFKPSFEIDFTRKQDGKYGGTSNISILDIVILIQHIDSLLMYNNSSVGIIGGRYLSIISFFNLF